MLCHGQEKGCQSSVEDKGSDSDGAVHRGRIGRRTGKEDLDVLIICGGSATDLPGMTPKYAEWYNVVDSFDTHANIPVHFKNVDDAAKKGGKSFYIQAPERMPDDQKYNNILRQTVIDIKAAENIIVIHTMNGCANAAAEVIDRISPECVVGTLAGDNTIFVAVDSRSNVESVLAVFRNAAL